MNAARLLALPALLIACAAEDLGPVPPFDAGQPFPDSGVGVDAGVLRDAGVSDAGIPAPPPRPALGAQIDRVGRPLVSRLWIAPLEEPAIREVARDAYNMAGAGAWPISREPIAQSLAFYDAFDGRCGNQLLADAQVIPERYYALATLLADDRLYLNAAAQECRQFLAVELAATGTEPSFALDCGGRTPSVDPVDVLYSISTIGAWTGVDDGLSVDERPTTSEFPFLAPPDL